MAITLVQSNSTMGASSRSSISLPAPPTQGNVVIVCVASASSVSPSTAMAGWTLADSTGIGTAGNTMGAGIFVKQAGAAESSGPWNFRVAALSTQWVCAVAEYTDLDSTNAQINTAAIGNVAAAGTTNATLLDIGSFANNNASTESLVIGISAQRSSASVRSNHNLYLTTASTAAATVIANITSTAGPIGLSMYDRVFTGLSTTVLFTGNCSGSVGVPSISGWIGVRGSSAPAVATKPHRLTLLSAGW